MSKKMYRDHIEFLGKTVKRGASLTLDFDVAKLHTRNNIQVPVFIERAKKDGPVLLLMGGVHGDEMNGVEIVRRILRNGLNKPDRGTIICIPVFNIFGFINLDRKFPDGRDLNRVFPGSSKGSLASQFAYEFTKEITPHVDYVIDFHSGGADRVNMAQTRCLLSDTESYELAKAFGAPFIVQSKYIAKSIRESFRKRGKTALLFEGGKSLRFDEEAIECGVRGAVNVMHHLGMKKGEIDPPAQSVVIKKSKWVRASHSGMLHVKVKNGTWIKKKTVMAVITDPFGEFERKVKAPFDCYVFCVNISTIVNRGDALFHVSVELEEEGKG